MACCRACSIQGEVHATPGLTTQQPGWPSGSSRQASLTRMPSASRSFAFASSAALLPLFFGQRLAIGFGSGGKRRARGELLRRARIPGFDIPAAALLAVPHIVNPFPESPALRNVRWCQFIHALVVVVALTRGFTLRASAAKRPFALNSGLEYHRSPVSTNSGALTVA